MANGIIEQPSSSQINEHFKFVTGETNSFHDIVKTGIYYVGNSMADKPYEIGGLYILASAYNTNNVMCGLFISNKTGAPEIYQVRCIDGNFIYTKLSV